MASARATVCPYTHLEPGFYPAPNGTIAVPAADHAQLVRFATNTAAEIAAAVAKERQAQLEARADITTALVETHGAQVAAQKDQVDQVKGLLADARDELRDREGRLRVLFTERQDDLGKREALSERVHVAEARDARIALDDVRDLRSKQLAVHVASINGDLWGKGLELGFRQLGPLVPLLGAAMLGKANGTTNGADVDGSLHSNPSELCFALCQLLWRLRDPHLVACLGQALLALGTHPALQDLGTAIRDAAPDAFQAVILVLAQMQSAPSAPSASTPSSGGATAAAPSASTNGAPHHTEPAAPAA